jgi:hypothetical protein
MLYTIPAVLFLLLLTLWERAKLGPVPGRWARDRLLWAQHEGGLDIVGDADEIISVHGGA